MYLGLEGDVMHAPHGMKPFPIGGAVVTVESTDLCMLASHTVMKCCASYDVVVRLFRQWRCLFRRWRCRFFSARLVITCLHFERLLLGTLSREIGLGRYHGQ